ncbi:MAG: VanZ family protein [Gammaproteobacteria bacterium]|nr:VanZ family protein [Gammaproteobacteria bacterium]
MARLPHARLWYALGAVLVALVVILSLVPMRKLPSIRVSDKLEHALAFTALTIWFGGLVPQRRYAVLALALLALGGAIEIAQGWMGLGRYADVRDLVADGWGIAFGLTLCALGLRHWAQVVERRWR